MLPPAGGGAAPVGHFDLIICWVSPDAHELSIRKRAGGSADEPTKSGAKQLEHVDNLMKTKNYIGENGGLGAKVALIIVLLQR